jgi:hypothetical protein
MKNPIPISQTKLFTVMFSFFAAFAFLFVPKDTFAQTMNTNMNNNTNWNNNWNTTHSIQSGYSATTSNVVHGTPPYVKYETMEGVNRPAVTVTAQNTSMMGVSTPLCAEQVINGRLQNIGCVPNVELKNAADPASIFSFNVWPHQQGINTTAQQTMIFTYRDQMGNWRQITSPTYQQQSITAPAQTM